MNIRTINLGEWNRKSIVQTSFLLGMSIAFLGSVTPWFFWPLGDKYVIPASICLLFSMSVAKVVQEENTCEDKKQKDSDKRLSYLIPLVFLIFLSSYQLFTRGKNINAYIVKIFFILTFFATFKTQSKKLRVFCDFLAKAMGGFLAISMFFFLLYLIGFPLPSRNADYANLYSYTNYYFFLIDDRNLFTIIPRFQSVFVEPGHLGTMSALLLFTQIGKWKNWYNISLLIATLISFSLAAYGILVPVIFLGLWIRGKQIIRKAAYAIGLLAAITIGSFYYNDGNNLLHDLIMIRLEIEDGQLAGDNRVTDDFKADYESLLQSSDIMTGRDRNDETFGNSGYRVFIYDYGLIGLTLLIIFYIIAMYQPEHKKAFLSVLFIAALNFIIRGNIMQFYIFITLYQVAMNSLELADNKISANEQYRTKDNRCCYNDL